MSQLEHWLNPSYLDPETIRHLSLECTSRSDFQYLVLDDFLREEKLSSLEEGPAEDLSFRWDPHSESHRRSLDPKKEKDSLFLSEDWARHLAALSGINSLSESSSVIATESYLSTSSSGYWIHSDKKSLNGNKKMISLFYNNLDWTDQDGGLLQLWKEVPYNKDFPTYKIQDFISRDSRKKLEFLLTAKEVNIAESLYTKSLILVNEILPLRNRLVILNLTNGAGFHSVTPTYGKIRRVISQFYL